MEPGKKSTSLDPIDETEGKVFPGLCCHRCLEHTRGDIERLLGIPRQRVTVIPNGVDRRFYPVGEDTKGVLSKYGIREPYFLYVGAFDINKNVTTLLQAFRRFQIKSRKSLQLVIVGGLLSDALSCFDDTISLTAIVQTGFVKDEDLPVLYSKAQALVTLSTYEGFCLAVLEAMACGTPVIASSTTVFPETVGNAGILVNPLDPDAAAAAMWSITNEPGLAADLRRRGLERASGYTWKRAAKATLAIYQKALAERQRSL